MFNWKHLLFSSDLTSKEKLVKGIGVVVLVLAFLAGVITPSVQLAGAKSELDQLKADQTKYVTSAEFDQYKQDTAEDIAAAKASGDDAATAFSNWKTETWTPFYTDWTKFYNTTWPNFYNSYTKLNIDNRITGLEQITQLTNPITNVEVISGGTIYAGQCVFDEELKLTINNPLPFSFPGQTLLLILQGDNSWRGVFDFNITSNGLHFFVTGDFSNSVHIWSNVFDIPARCTITINLKIHFVFDLPVENDITFTPILGFFTR
jgi:type II secretory pathway pseudopilin PulG